MKTLVLIGKVYLYLVGAFFVLMAVDCFGSVGCPDCESIWDHLFCFMISIIPAIIIILTNYFLRHREKLLGIILIALSVIAFFFFKFYRDFLEKIPTLLIIVLIPLSIGILFLYTRKKST